MWSVEQALAYAAEQVVKNQENEHNECCHFVAECYGFGYSGYVSAIAHAQAIHLQQGNAPAGALVFWDGGLGHEALSNGKGQVYSNDIETAGKISLVPEAEIHTKWGKTRLGWALPSADSFKLSGGTNPNGQAPAVTPPPAPKPTPAPVAPTQKMFPVTFTMAGNKLGNVTVPDGDTVSITVGTKAMSFVCNAAISVEINAQAPAVTPPPPVIPKHAGTVYADALDTAAKGGTQPTEQVNAVQLALVAQNLLTLKQVTGVWDTATKDAYSKFQLSVGLKGTAPGQDADGSPGLVSLTKLAQDSKLFVAYATTPQLGSKPSPIPVSAVRYLHVDDSVSFSKTILPAVFKIMDIPAGPAQAYWTSGLMTAAGRESSYNFNAVNNWDSNATGPNMEDGKHANDSRGVMQCIPETFADFHQPGTSNNIYDAIANTCSAMNYVMGPRYNVSRDGHDLAAKVQQFDPSRKAMGY